MYGKKNEFDNARTFDIILAKRDSFDDEKSYGASYLVVGRDKEKLYCLRGIQKVKDYFDPYIVFSRLIKNKMGEEKIIYYIDVDIEEIDYNKFINTKTRLSLEEKMDLICELKKKGNLIDKNKINMDLSIKVGDIVKLDKQFIVVYKSCDKFLCVEFDDGRDLESAIYIKEIENINYSNTKVFNIDVEFKFINRVSDNLLKKILTNYKKENNNLIDYMEKQRNMRIGLLIELNGNLYYVYNKDADNLFCHQVIKDNYDNNCNIVIANNNYMCDFNNTLSIKIMDSFKILSLASKNEIVNIINRKIDYCIKNLVDLKDNLLGFKIGMTFNVINNNGICVFLNQVDNMVKYIELNDLNSNIINTKYTNISNIIRVDSLTAKEIQNNRHKVKKLLK